jgi:hypothetical protein
LAGVYFYSLNQNIRVDEIMLGFNSYTNVHLYEIVFFTLGLGIIWTVIISLIQEIRLRFKMMHLRNENNKLRREIDALRMQPLDDILVDPVRAETNSSKSDRKDGR